MRSLAAGRSGRWVRVGIAALGALLIALEPESAAAGCPSLCELSVATAVVTPPIVCAKIEARPQKCNCALEFLVRNDCSFPIEAVNFEFRACSEVNGPIAACSTLTPRHQGVRTFSQTTVGPIRERLVLRTPDGDHQVELSGRVASFDDGGCTAGRVGTDSSSSYDSSAPLALAAAALILALGARRRSSARPC
jgi:hypothetical protein